MIVVDTSALMAIVLLEPKARACAQALEQDNELLISAATVTEALIVSARRGLSRQMTELIEDLGLIISPLMEEDARRAAQAHDRWGRGVHPARLNFGDCFAYALAQQRGCPLLYVGEDFAQTDIASALGG